VDTAHQAAALAVQVGVDLLLEGGLVEDSNGRVDTAALTEEGADGAAGALGGDENDVDVGGDLDLGEVLEDGREAVGEVEGLWWLIHKHIR
jgi:hypothetical protein